MKLRFLMGCVICLVGGPVGAQAPAVLRGVVLDDSSGTPLSGADILLNGGAQTARSDARGEFTIQGLAPGEQVITIRLLGFSQLTAAFDLPANAGIIEFALVRNVQRLAGTEIVGERDPLERGKLSEFYRRKEFGIGTFLTAEVFENARSSRVAEILRSRLPGSRIVNSRCSSRSFVATTRGSGSIQDRLFVVDCDKLLDRSCPVAVYLDGINVYRGMVGEPLFDVNSVSPSEISGIEFYSGASQLPPEYRPRGPVECSLSGRSSDDKPRNYQRRWAPAFAGATVALGPALCITRDALTSSPAW